MELLPQDVGIILSYHCNSACKHCLYNCGPRWEREPMSEETLSAALDAVVNWPQPPQVHLTGGEPFLHFDLLLHGVREAASRWIACYVETSASWCVDEEETFARFRMLREAGLQAVLISCSPFHAEKIPPVRTLRAIRAVMEVFGGRGLIVYQAEYLNMIRRHDVDRPLPLSHYEQEFGRDDWLYVINTHGHHFWRTIGICPGAPGAQFPGAFVRECTLCERDPPCPPLALRSLRQLHLRILRWPLHRQLARSPASVGGLSIGTLSRIDRNAHHEGPIWALPVRQ